jgi:hypothetical protein
MPIRQIRQRRELVEVYPVLCLSQLRRQLDARLRPVLREQEFARFDLPRGIETVQRVAEALARYRQRPGSDRVVK